MALINNTSPFLNDLGYENLTSDQQETIDALIDVTSELIEKECNRVFAADIYIDELHDGDDLNSIHVKNLPLISVDEIKVKPTYQEDDLEFESTLFDFNAKTGEIWWLNLNQIDAEADTTNYIGRFPLGRQNIKISYHGGFSSVPTPIQKLCADLVIGMYDPSAVADNIESEKLGQYFYKLRKSAVETTLTNNKRIISLYKIRKV